MGAARNIGVNFINEALHIHVLDLNWRWRSAEKWMDRARRGTKRMLLRNLDLDAGGGMNLIG